MHHQGSNKLLVTKDTRARKAAARRERTLRIRKCIAKGDYRGNMVNAADPMTQCLAESFIPIDINETNIAESSAKTEEPGKAKIAESSTVAAIPSKLAEDPDPYGEDEELVLLLQELNLPSEPGHKRSLEKKSAPYGHDGRATPAVDNPYSHHDKKQCTPRKDQGDDTYMDADVVMSSRAPTPIPSALNGNTSQQAQQYAVGFTHSQDSNVSGANTWDKDPELSRLNTLKVPGPFNNTSTTSPDCVMAVQTLQNYPVLSTVFDGQVFKNHHSSINNADKQERSSTPLPPRF